MSKSKFRAEVIDLILSQPDEFISLAQVTAGEAFLRKLADWAAT